MKIIIETESLEELRQIAKELSGAAPEKPKKAKKEPKVEEATPAPAPEPEPVPAPEPVPEQPLVPTTEQPAERVYQMDELARAGAGLMQQDRSNSKRLSAILRTFGVNSLPDLPKEKYADFAEELRKLGATV